MKLLSGTSILEKIARVCEDIVSSDEKREQTAKMLREDLIPASVFACEKVTEQFELFAELRRHVRPEAVDFGVMRPAAAALRDKLNEYLAETEPTPAPPPPETDDDGKKIVWN